MRFFTLFCIDFGFSLAGPALNWEGHDE